MFMMAITGGIRDRSSIVRSATELTGFGTHHLKIRHLGILSILS